MGRMHNNQITVDDVAKHLGFSRSYCSLILNSKRNPSGIREKMETAVSEIITEYDDDGHMICAKMARVDGSAIKENVYYTLKNGEFVEVKP